MLYLKTEIVFCKPFLSETDCAIRQQVFPCGLWLERSLAKHGRLCLILSWVIPKTLKMISAAFLALTLSM